jgi:hypothetical protein
VSSWRPALPGVHGPGRERRWDAVVTAELPGVPGAEVAFSTLPDGSLVGAQDAGAELEALAEVVEQEVEPPYRAHAVCRSHGLWAVAAVATEVVEIRHDVAGDEIELIVRDDERSVFVDGERIFGSVPALERHARGRYESYVARAERLDGDLWEVEVLPL